MVVLGLILDNLAISDINGLVQDCNISINNVLQILQ